MVKATVDIFDHEDKIVAMVKEKFGFRSKNEALNFIIRKFEPHIKDLSKVTHDIFIKEAGEESKKEVKKRGRPRKGKKLSDQKDQSFTRLKKVMSEKS